MNSPLAERIATALDAKGTLRQNPAHDFHAEAAAIIDAELVGESSPMKSTGKSYTSVVDMVRDISGDDELVEELERQIATRDLITAAKLALEHTQELREAWRTGALSERDGMGGSRSNRNVDVEHALRTALASLDGEGREDA